MKRVMTVVKNALFIIGCISFMSNLEVGLPVKAVLAETINNNSKVVETDDFMDYSQAVSELAESHSEVTPEKVAGLNQYYTKRLIVKGKDDSISFDKYSVDTMVKGPDNITILQFSSIQETKECLEELNKNPNVEFAESDILFGLEASFDKSSTFSVTSIEESTEMGIKSTYNSWGVKKVEGDKYNKYLAKKKKTEIIVAVIDTGVSDHKFLKGRIAKGGYDFSDGDKNPSDRNGHGTHVAGTIVDTTPNLNVKILPIRALNQNGVGSSTAIANGIQYAADNGAKVINLSLGGGHSQHIENAVNYAIKKGVVVVVAAGNEYENVEYSCPAHIKKCITVSAIDSKDRRADFSNFGSMVDVAAPGVDILSCVPGGGYVYASGTSMAAPHISAVVAMIRLSYPSKQPSEVEKILKSISKDLGTKGWDRYFGFGLPKLTKIINAKKISLNQTSAKVMKNTKLKLIATVAPGGFVTWSSSDNKIASVDEDGLVKGKKIGKTVITAMTVNGLKATCNVSVISDKIPAVEPTKIKLDQSKVNIRSGESLVLYGTIKPSNATVKDIIWTSSDEVVADVSEFGTVTAYHGGSAVITATTANGLSATCKVTVTGDGTFPTKVTLNHEKVKVLIGENIPVWATTAPETATDKRLKWSSSNDNITISAEGTLKAVKEGTTHLRVTTMNALYDECEVMIIDPKNVIEPKDISLSQHAVRIEVEEMAYLFATVIPLNATDPAVTFSSNNTLIADVTQDGVIIAKRKGYTTITARTSNGLKATCTVTVSDKAISATAITLNKTEVELFKNSSFHLTATVLPSNAADKQVTWSVEDKAIVEVNAGYINAKSEGRTVVTATTSNGLTAACVVTVKAVLVLPKSVAFDESSIKEIKVGEMLTLKANIYPDNASDKTLSFSSSHPDIADVRSDGTVTAYKEGETRITVKTSNGLTAACKIIVAPMDIMPVTIALNYNQLELETGKTEMLIATVTPENTADKTVTFSSSDALILEVNSNGMITAHSAGTAVVTATTAGGVSAACIVTVKDSLVTEVTVTDSQMYTQFSKRGLFLKGKVCYNTKEWLYSSFLSKFSQNMY